MDGASKDLMMMCIRALKDAYEYINSISCSRAIRNIPAGKADTFGLDYETEYGIKDSVRRYDEGIVLITEETGKMYHGKKEIGTTEVVLIADPTDRSKLLRGFLAKKIEENKSNAERYVGDILVEGIEEWNMQFGPPMLSGSSGSITAVKDRRILFNVMANYVTGDMFISCPLGNKHGKVGKKLEKFSDILFPSTKREIHKFAAYVGTQDYVDNLEKCNFDAGNCIDKKAPGPTRILQLSSLNADPDIGFILSNGEKIGEWMGWLAWAKYAKDLAEPDERALGVYRLFFENPKTRDLVVVAPAPHYSIFQDRDGETLVDLDMMFRLDNPSTYRETLMVIPVRNLPQLAKTTALGMKAYHELKL